MAASMEHHARICLQFENKKIDNSWFLVNYSEHQNISDIIYSIKTRYNVASNTNRHVVLRVKGYVLPAWESSLLLKDEDQVHVSIEKLREGENATEALILSTDSQCNQASGQSRKRKHEKEKSAEEGKRKKNEKQNLGQSLAETTEQMNNESEDTPVRETKKLNTDGLVNGEPAKKRERKREERKKHAQSLAETTETIIDESENRSVSDTKKLRTDKLVNDEVEIEIERSKSNKTLKKDQIAECAVTDGAEPGSTDDEAVNNEIREENLDEVANSHEGSVIPESETDNFMIINGNKYLSTKKKRKRIRKHRKRKNADNSSLGASDICSNDLGKLNTSSDISVNKNTYKGRDICKDELFFGSIPDKLVSPKFYRHGYRNLNVYHPEPNTCKKFDSDSEEETTVKKNVEQYNFLSSTTILENRDKCNVETESFCGNSPNRNERLGEYTVSNKGDQKQNIYSQHKVSGISNELQVGVDNSLSTEEIEPTKQNGSDIADDSWSETKSENTSEAFTATPYRYPGPRSKESSTGPSWSPQAASPTVLERKQLASGVSVYTRKRRSPYQGQAPFMKVFTEEEQLNTVASNISTIFTNPEVLTFKVPTSPAQKQQTSTPLRSDSEDSYDFQVSMIETVPSRSAVNETVPSRSVAMETKQTDTSGTETVSTVAMLTRDYRQFPPLVGSPRPGDRIAYKVLEISVSFTPEVSAYKEAEVVSVDSSQMIQLKNTVQPILETPYNKFLVEIEEDGEILTNRQQEPEEVTLHVSSLLEPRLLS